MSHASLPARPDFAASPAAAASSSKPLISRIAQPAGLPAGLPAKPSFALPLRPPTTSNYSRPLHDADSRSPSPPRRRIERDSYVPRSPTPERGEWDRRDSYRPGPSGRTDWDRGDTYVTRSPSPLPRSRRQDSLDRRSSFTPDRRSPSPRSPSPELPKTFFTFYHKKGEERAARDEERRVQAEAKRQQQAERQAERAARRAELEVKWAAEREERRSALYGSQEEAS